MTMWDFLHAHMGFTWTAFGCSWLAVVLVIDALVTLRVRRKP